MLALFLDYLFDTDSPSFPSNGLVEMVKYCFYYLRLPFRRELIFIFADLLKVSALAQLLLKEEWKDGRVDDRHAEFLYEIEHKRGLAISF